MAETFLYDDGLGRAALGRMKRAQDGITTLAGEDWTQAAMATLLDAEFLAAQAGIVPWLTLPSGERGLLTIGAAREKLDRAPEDIRTIYLAAHGIVRSTHAMAKPSTGKAPSSIEEQSVNALTIGALPIGIIIALTVVGLASVVGTAWYFSQKASIEVQGQNLRATAVASEVAALAREQLAATGEIDPAIWETFRAIAAQEGQRSWLPWALGGLVLAGGGIAAYSWWQHSKKGTHRELT